MDTSTLATEPKELARMHEREIKEAIMARFRMSHDALRVHHEHSFRGMNDYYSFHAADKDVLYRVVGRVGGHTLEDIEVSALNKSKSERQVRNVKHY